MPLTVKEEVAPDQEVKQVEGLVGACNFRVLISVRNSRVA